MICYGVKIGKNVRFNGFPIIYREPDSKIIIGDNCIFNSSKHSIPIGLFRPCAFVTMKKGAEIIIGNNTGATGVTIAALESIRIGNDVLIGANATIMDTDFHKIIPSKRKEKGIIGKPIVIEDNVFLGFNCLVLKGVNIGKNSVIGANSVVITPIAANTIVMGNPTKLIMKCDWESVD